MTRCYVRHIQDKEVPVEQQIGVNIFYKKCVKFVMSYDVFLTWIKNLEIVTADIVSTFSVVEFKARQVSVSVYRFGKSTGFPFSTLSLYEYRI